MVELLSEEAAKNGPSRRVCTRFPSSPTGSKVGWLAVDGGAKVVDGWRVSALRTSASDEVLKNTVVRHVMDGL